MKELKIDATHDNPEGDGKRINPLTCEFGGIVHFVPTSNPEISNVTLARIQIRLRMPCLFHGG
jgi:hypothetical protein